ncbi:AMP-binding protein [Atopomonas sediminilitoris]|uniref:AMP-binding protein n=1 Tax=Atopomonas sediminilitoris TaxID=2919919 RepID=UPI001F4E6C1B|nr:AMP-binding protein [Atopomonas sediminilitoris]MCJ8170369.1 AMP-binding protein [Atopomonas sediminilitoris]
MSWIDLPALLLSPDASRQITLAPALNHALLNHALLNHAQLCHDAGRLAAALKARNIQHIAVHCRDSATLATCLLGAWQADIAVYLPADLQPASYSALADHVELWLGDSDLAHFTAPHTLIAEQTQGLAARQLNDTVPLLWVCTSGSTGAAKRIGKTLAQLNAELCALESLWGEALHDAHILGSVSTQHLYGLLFRLLWPLAAGRTFGREQLGYPEDVLHQAQRSTRCAWVASPALLKRLPEHLEWAGLRQTMRAVFSSGGPLPAAASAQIAQWLTHAPIEIYGSSETGGVAWRQASDHWQPLPSVELSQDASGALQVRSAFLPAGHCEHTADAVELTAQGMRLLGRLDRIVKLEEKRIALPALEQRLESHPWVSDARLGLLQQGRAHLGAVIALNAAGVFALRNQGRQHVTQTLRTHLRGYCENLALPRRWRLLQQLPFNSQGKLSQQHIEQLLNAERARQPELISQRVEGDNLLCELLIPLDLAHFSGHFPGTPIVPGVLQIDWAIALARQLLDLKGEYAGMEVIKFQRLLRPGDRPQLSLRFDQAKQKLHFSLRHNDEACSSGRIRIEVAHV